MRTAQPMVADELRRQADNFIELADLAPRIMRDHAARDHARDATQSGPANNFAPGAGGDFRRPA